MTSTTEDAFEALRRACDEAEARLVELANSDGPLRDQFAAALDVYTARRRLSEAQTPATTRARLGEALDDLLDPHPAADPAAPANDD